MNDTKNETALSRPVTKQGEVIPVKLGPPNKVKGPSLLARIHAATSVDDVDKLMTEGDNYRGATLQVRRRWVRAAACRKVEITSPPPAPKVEAKKPKAR